MDDQQQDQPKDDQEKAPDDRPDTSGGSDAEAIIAQGTYRALPIVEEDIVEHLFVEDGLVDQLAEALEDLNMSIHRVDEEMEGLKHANPGLGRLVQSSVDGLYGVLKDELPNEASRAYLRVCTYFGTFLILRALDLQWRRQLPP